MNRQVNKYKPLAAVAALLSVFCLAVWIFQSLLVWLLPSFSQSSPNLIWLLAGVTSVMLLSLPGLRLIKRLSGFASHPAANLNVASLIDQAADIILITQIDGKIVQANRRACEVLGYTMDELLDKHTMDIDIDAVMHRNPRYHHDLYMGDAVTFDTHYRAKDGTRVPVENHVTNAGWRGGTLYLEIARDITHRREVEKQLHDSKEALERVRNRLELRMQERTEELVEEVRMRELTEKQMHEISLLLENLVNSMPSVIIALDDTLRVTQWNLEAEKVFGVLESHAINQTITQLLPQFRTHIIQLVRDSQFGRESLTRNIEVELSGKHNRYSVMLYPLSHTAGADAPGVVIRLDDITEKTRFDEMLVQTEKMMSLGGLAAGMAHEINNPLGAILQSAQNIARRLQPDFPRNRRIAEQFGLNLKKLQQYLEQQRIMQSLDAVQEAGQRAATIVSDMLSFARPNESRAAAVDLIEALQSSIRLAEKDYNQKRQYDFRNIDIVQSYQDNLPAVFAQKNQLNQVFLNLLINAAQALVSKPPLGKPQITVSAGLVGERIVVEISDNGPGMDEATRRRVFEPFFTTKQEGRGTGLGLSVSYFIITEQLGGQMLVESMPGKGTKFVIRLPFLEQPKPPSKPPQDDQIQLPLDQNG